jgi:predicted Zn-dependent protease
MKSRPWLAALLLAASLLASGCLTLMGGEEKAGAEAARQAEAEMGLVEDPALVAYVREIGERLVVNASRQDVTWRFRIVDMAEPNAFALPGGYVYVSRGLLALVNDEAELAGVVGHEIGHVTAGHGNKRVTLSAPFMILSGITGWATGIISPRLGEAVAGAGNTMAQGLVIAPFSRRQESEADRIGANLSARAGWDPGALGNFLETLGRYEKLVTGEERRTSWLDSHPASPERAAASREFAAKLERGAPNPVAADRADLFRRLDGLVLGADPAAGVTLDDRFVHPELGWSIQFPPGWAVMNNASAVASQEPGAQAAIVLQLAAVYKTLDALLAEIEEEGPKNLEIERRSVNGRAAARTSVTQKGRRIDITWLEHGGHVYQIAGVSAARQYETWRPSFEQTIDSFRDIQATELQRIRDRRLRIATAAANETLAALLTRVGSDWDPSVAAVVNATQADARFDSGRLVKFSREEPYTPRNP